MMRVTIRGMTYEDVPSAAQELGVAPDTVYCGIIRGSIDRIGLGVDYKSRVTRGGLPPKAVVIAGRRFSSMAELARAIGRDPRSVRTSLRAGGIAHRRIALAVMKIIADEEQAAMHQNMTAGDKELSP